MSTWLDDVSNGFEYYGGIASLSDIYSYIQLLSGRQLSNNWQAVVRQTIEDHSSDGAFRTGKDIFYSVHGKGYGIWGIRAFEGSPPLDPNQIPSVQTYPEGALQKITVNKFERNRKTRSACIEYYGSKCFACGFDFELVYGPVGHGYIHVHHIVPISSLQERYIVNPINDLRPLCPNCHAMVHAKDPPMPVEELRDLVARHRV